MSDEQAVAGLGVRIERPQEARLGAFFYLLLLTSLTFIGFTIWLLVFEWLGMPLPMYLRTLLAT